MELTLNECILLLKEHHLLKSSAVQNKLNVKITNISYDSRDVKKDGLFFCKGNAFRSVYLTMAKDNGATIYVAEKPYMEGNGMNALIVRNVQKAMSILSAAFYGYPQDDLFIIAFTGTKGKTTSSYFTRGILNGINDNKTALFSTIDTIIGNKPQQRFKSSLTTPESLDLFRNMRQAVDNGMTNLVMEVSSQAYLRNRVFGLTYDVGFFLNITPDHIGVNEHSNFDNYLHCKLQLLINSRECVINAETYHFGDVYAAATTTTNPDSIYLYSSSLFKKEHNDMNIDFVFEPLNSSLTMSEFQIKSFTEKAKSLSIDGKYKISLIGDFNESNATAAIIAGGLAGANYTIASKSIRDIKVPGRMESIDVHNHGRVYIDYAHNYASLKSLLGFLKNKYNDPRLIVVIGATGDKGQSRRSGLAKALNMYASKAILTTDDPGFEDPKDIAEQIKSFIDLNKVSVSIELDRSQAIYNAILDSKPKDIVVIAGKGADPYQKIRGIDTPYPTDIVIVKDIAANFEDK